MNRMTILAIAVLFSTSLNLSSLYAVKTIDRTFRVQPGGELLVETDAGDVTLRGSATQEVKVHIEADRDLEGRIEFSFVQNGNRIEIYGKAEEKSILGFLKGRSFNGRLQITIDAPQSFNPSVRTSGGDVDASGIEGKTELRTSGGDVSAARMSGELSLHTSGGDIDAMDVNGPLTAFTSGGDVSAHGIIGACTLTTSGGDVSAAAVRGDCVMKTSGGNITADSLDGGLSAVTSGGNIEACLRSQPRNACDMRTSGGSIVLSVPASISAELSARTSGGNIKSGIPVKVFDSEEGKMEGTLGQGGPALTLRTSGGNIWIKVSD